MADPQIDWDALKNSPALQSNSMPPGDGVSPDGSMAALPLPAQNTIANVGAPSSQPNADAVMSALGDKSRQYQALTGQESAEMAPVLNRMANATNQPMHQPPDLKAALMQSPQAKDYMALGKQIQKSSQDYMGTAGLLSGLVGVFARKHTTLAIKAFTSAVDGFKQGQDDAVKQQLEIFKQASDQAVSNAKALNDQYEEVLKNRELSLDEMRNQMSAIALKYQDPLMAQKMDAMDFLGMQKLMDSREKAANTTQGISEKIYADVKQIPYKKQDLILQAAIGSDDPDVHAAGELAKEVLAYKQALPSIGRFNPIGNGANAIVNQISDVTGKPYDAAKYKAHQAALGKLAQSQVPPDIGKTEQNIFKVNNHLDTLQNAMDQLYSGDVRTVNKAVQAFAKEFGDPKIVSAETAVNAVSQEFHKVYVPTGGVEDERRAAAENISPESSPEQIKAAIKTMKELMTGQAKGIYLVSQAIQNGQDVSALNVPASYVDYVAGLTPKSETPSSSGAPADNASASSDGWGKVQVH